jgi:hypothetical protein
MKKLKILPVFFTGLALLVGGFLAQPVLAAPGDVNGNGIAGEIGDLVYLLQYLFGDGPAPPNPIDADMDGTAGINVGDALQLTEFFLTGCDFNVPYTGACPTFSEIEFTFPVITSGKSDPFDVSLELTDNPGPDLAGIAIAFSYQHQAGHVGVDLDTVDFANSVVPGEWEMGAYIDNVNKRALLLLNSSSDYPPLSSGTTGLVATLTFTRTDNPAGEATFLRATVFPPTHSSMLITGLCADGTSPPERMLVPKFVFGRNGDLNCDGKVDVADLGYLINHLFLGGSPPCNW